MSDKRVHFKCLEHFAMTYSLCLLQSQSSPSTTITIIFTLIQIQSVFVGLPPSIPIHHHNSLFSQPGICCNKDRWLSQISFTIPWVWNTITVRYVQYKYKSLAQMHQWSYVHSSTRCTNIQTNIGMQWDVPVCMYAYQKTVNSISYRYCPIK